jgi:ParB family chromosome partitioning protein
LIGAPDPEVLAREIVTGALNVRQAEKKVQAPRSEVRKPAGKDADTRALEHSLTNSLGMDVAIEHQGKKGGMVTIRYRTLEQLDEVIRRLNSYGEVD